jgi:hypothetical protein
MTDDQELSVLLHDWLIEGPREMPDRVIDVVAQRIRRQPQRPAWRLDRRLPMNTSLKAAAALAAVILVAVIGYNLLLAGRPVSAARHRLQSHADGPLPTGSPVASGPVALPQATLTAGRYRMKPTDTLSVVADGPAGWQGFDNPALVSPGNGLVLIAFMVTDAVYSDPCHWDEDGTKTATKGGVRVGPTVDDLVAALKANTSYTSSAAHPDQRGRGRWQGDRAPTSGDDVIRACDKRPGEAAGDYFPIPNGYYAQGPNNRWHLYIADVHGTRLITMVSISEGASEADIAACPGHRAVVRLHVVNPLRGSLA